MTQSWSEHWFNSKGYHDAMEAIAKRDTEFWERHHKIMAELDKETKRLHKELWELKV